MFKGENIRVFDIETLNSADDLSTGWSNKAALGISIGAFWDYRDSKIHWFDRSSLEETMRLWVSEQPLLVGFNSIAFDATLMHVLLRQEVDEVGYLCPDRPVELIRLCDDFKELAAKSYDILAEIWRVDSGSKFARSLNSLDAILEANGLGQKIGHGAQAPKDWQAGKYAQVMNYCSTDVYLTKSLFELIIEQGGKIKRSNGDIELELPKFLDSGC